MAQRTELFWLPCLKTTKGCVEMLRLKRFIRGHGFSLIAVMISAGIGVFLLLSMTQLIAVSRQNYNSNTEIARMYDNARFAINYLTSQVSLAAQSFYGSGSSGVWPNAGDSLNSTGSGKLPGTYPYATGSNSTFPMYIPGYQSLGCRGSTSSWASPITNISTDNSTSFSNFIPANSRYSGRPDTCAFNSGQFPAYYGATPGLRFFYIGTESFGNIKCTNQTSSALGMQRSLFLNPNNESFNRTDCTGGYSATVGPLACCSTGYFGCTLLGNTQTYNCGGSEGTFSGDSGSGLHAAWIYERVIPHIQPANASFTGTTLGSGTTNGLQNSDTLTIAFSNKSGASINNCTNGTVPSATGTDLGQLAYSTFTIGLWNNTAATDATCTPLSSSCLPNLQCKPQLANISSTGTTSGTTLPIIEGIEYMKIMLGEDVFGERDLYGSKATSPSRWVDPSNTSIDYTNVVAVRIAIVVRSTNAFLSKASQPTLFLMRGASGVALTYTPSSADNYMRKVFVFTIPLTNFSHRDYPEPTDYASSTPNGKIINAPNVYPAPANQTYSGTYNGYSTPYNYTYGMDYERHCVGTNSYTPNGGNSTTGIANAFVIKIGGVRTQSLDGNNGYSQQLLQSGDRCCASNVSESDNVYQYTGSGASSAFQCRLFRNLTGSNACESDRAFSNNYKCKYFWTVP
jgi:hypothetical protein